jgi:plastocyanin
MMNQRTLLMALLALGGLGGTARPAPAAKGPEGTGSIVCTVRYTGKVPAGKRVITEAGPITLQPLVVDAKTKGLRWAVAVVEGVPARPKVKGGKPVVIDQESMLFKPRVVAVQHGRAVRFDNSDACTHSVQALSRVREDQFNRITTSGEPVEHTFALQKHPVQIGCALHPWMRAWVVVVAHPWFAVSDARGECRIAEVPAGEYTLWVRHPDTGLSKRIPVKVEAGKVARVAVEWSRTEDSPGK